MSRQAKVEGTKIAQAAKDLNVTSVTIRRYLTEFNIETTTDENGIKVLPPVAMEELQEIRKLKEDGLTNPRVLEILEELRAKPKTEKPTKAKGKSAKAEPAAKEKEKSKEKEKEAKKAEPAAEAPAKTDKRKSSSKRAAKVEETEAEEPVEVAEPVVAEESEEEVPLLEEAGDGRSKHSLTCQTCGKVFEHMNPRLRDCLDCYRAKRKERRRGGSDRHKNVIQHPLAQSVASKSAQPASEAKERPEKERPEKERPERERPERERPERERPERERPEKVPALAQSKETISFAPAMVKQAPVRNYRKAIEETRQITGSLKRRLERPDLPEGERRWLEQIYAYQLILHQGWRHLAEYKATTQQQGKGHED